MGFMNDSTNMTRELFGLSPTSDNLENAYFEIPFLILVAVLGTVGNVFVTGVGLSDRRLKNIGVAFIVNWAFADLYTTGVVLPIIAANIFKDYGNVLAGAMPLCHVVGFLASFCFEVPAVSILFVATQRYWRAIRASSYKRHFSRWRTAAMIGSIWIYCFLIAIPLLTGWLDGTHLLVFDESMVACMWNDHKAFGYNLFLVISAVVLPLVVAIYLFFVTLKHMKNTRRPTRQLASPNASGLRSAGHRRGRLSTDVSSCNEDSVASAVRTHHTRQNSINAHKTFRSKRSEERDRKLLHTLIVATVFFVLFRTPYLAKTLAFGSNVTPLVNRACWWLALCNSAVNPIIFGAVNSDFRRAYKKLIGRVFDSLCRSLPSKQFMNGEKQGASVKSHDSPTHSGVKFG